MAVHAFESAAATAPVLRELGLSLAPHQSVRVVAFDKSPDMNRALPWSQDRVIAVRAKHTVSGFANWSLKSGQWHCEPPVSILAPKRFARVHLDDASVENGAMELAHTSEAVFCRNTRLASPRTRHAKCASRARVMCCSVRC